MVASSRIATQPNQLHVDFYITRDDVIACSRHISLESPKLRKQRRTGRLLVPGLMLIFAVYQLFLSGLEYWYHAILWAGLAIFFSVKHSSMMIAGMEQSIKDHASLMESKGLLGLRRFSISPDCLTEAGQLIAVTWQWAAVEKIEVWEKYVLFYTSEFNCAFVPQSAFPDDGAFQTFVRAAYDFHRNAAAHAIVPIT